MTADMRTLAELLIPVDPHTVTRALDWLERIGHQHHWPSRTLYKLRLCLDEALTNTVMHGFPSGKAAQGEPSVELRLHEEGRDITLDILDNGRPFDPTAAESRSLDESLEEAMLGGHGLRLRRHYLKDIRYHRRGTWNHLELVAEIDTAS